MNALLNVFKRKTYCLLGILNFLVVLHVQSQNEDCNAPVGMNLGELHDVLVDVFKTARPFWEGNINTFEWDTGNPIPKDSNGYPTAINSSSGAVARTLVLEGTRGAYSEGTYTLLYDGRGKMFIDEGYDPINVVYDTAFSTHNGINNRITFQVNPSDLGCIIEIEETMPSNHIRNIRLIRPNDPGTDYLNSYDTDYFRSTLYDRLEGFSVLRFMDWQGTNFSPIQTWNDRTLLSHQKWNGNFGEGTGMPIEALVQLVNRTGISPWFCMPHRADDQFINQFASYVNDHINANIPIYVEYSNETWNDTFSDDAWLEGQSGQSSYATAMGNANGWTGYFESFGRWTAQRSVEIFDIWDSVFGTNQDQIIKVLGIQVGPDLGTPFTLDHVVNGSPAWQQADYLAMAPYFGGEFSEWDYPDINTWSVDRLIDSVEAHIFAYDHGPYWAERTVDLIQGAPYNGAIEAIAYEGGHHLYSLQGPPVSEGGVVAQLFTDAARHPRMGDIYQDYLDWWTSLNQGPMVLFNLNSTPTWGNFGLMDAIDQPMSEVPSFAATKSWIDEWCLVNPINEVSNHLSDIKVFPNPVSEYLHIGSDFEISALEITNLLGQVVASYSNINPSGINVSAWPNGTYFIRLKNRNTKDWMVQKIIKL